MELTTASFALESRQLMATGQLTAAGPLGLNLAGAMDYVDLMKQARAFTPLGASTLATDANGWPLADAQIIVLDDRVNQSFNGPDPNATAPDLGGTYHLSFTGQATLSPDYANNYTVQNQVYNATTNTTTADLVVTHNSLPMIYIDFTHTVNPASSTGAGVSNVTLLQPGYAANTTQLFTNTYLSDLAPFTTLRYLNVDQANNYQASFDANGQLIPLQWSQRKLPTASSQESGPGAPGEAWEYMIALANATNTDMWINIPGPASNDYVTQLANLIKNGDTINGVHYAGLNSNLKVNLELSNEVWGGVFTPAYYNGSAAIQRVNAGNSDLNSDGSTDSNVWAQRYYLERTMEVTNLFRGVFGADPTYQKIRPVLGWQEQNVAYYTTTFPWFEQHYGAPSQYFYGMGDANYAGSTDFSSVDNFFTSLNSTLQNQYLVTQQFSTVAAYYGMQVVAYEGGDDSNATNTTQGQVALAANRDPRMQTFLTQLYSTWYAAGGNLAEVYDGPYGTYTPYYQYNLVELSQAANPMASPKYRAMVALSQAGPQAVTAGTMVKAAGITGLPLANDSLGQSFTQTSVGQINHWLLNVPTAGTYTLTLQTTATSALNGQVTVSLSDSSTVGTYSLGKPGSATQISFTLHAGLNTLAIATLSPYEILNATVAPQGTTVTASALGDLSFEADQVGTGTYAYVYDPSGSAWTFAGTSGLTANGTVFTAGNPAAPSGQQVAFLQNQGEISQNFAVGSLGVYHLNFAMAQRAGYAAQTIQIYLDDEIINTFTTSGTAYQSLSSSSFVMTPGTHLLTFKGTNNVGDATAFLDSIGLVQETTPAPVTTAPTFTDSSFETVSAGSGFYGFVYQPTGSAWTFSGLAGLASNGSAFTTGGANAPQGQQVAFLQNLGSISQTLSGIPAGNYHINFAAALRTNYGKLTQTVQVLVDGQLIGTYTPATTSYQSLVTPSFALSAGTHVFTFRGTNSNGDATAFVDSIGLAQDSSSTVTSAPAFGDSSFETVSAGTGPNGYIYQPTGSAWTFSGSAGLTANGSAFTAGGASAPQGQQAAFLQNQGSIKQTLTNVPAGTYHISFAAALRTNYGKLTQSIQILVDNQVVSTISPNTGIYQPYMTSSFALSAGSHTFAFQGLNSSGDATAFLDVVSLVQESVSPVASASGILDPGFESISAGSGSSGYVYGPQGSPWVFTGLSGITANGTAFTAGNPNAPQGQQVAFLQSQAAISQIVNNVAAGNYTLSFAVAQRANYTGYPESFQVYIDGQVVMYYTTNSTSYQTVATPTFSLTAGTHVISFRTSNTVNFGTAFLDNVALNQQ